MEAAEPMHSAGSYSRLAGCRFYLAGTSSSTIESVPAHIWMHSARRIFARQSKKGLPKSAADLGPKQVRIGVCEPMTRPPVVSRSLRGRASVVTTGASRTVHRMLPHHSPCLVTSWVGGRSGRFALSVGGAPAKALLSDEQFDRFLDPPAVPVVLSFRAVPVLVGDFQLVHQGVGLLVFGPEVPVPEQD